VALPPAPVLRAVLRTRGRAAPVRVVGLVRGHRKASEGHLRAGTRVEAVRKWKEAPSYAERYVAKPEGFPTRSRTGRVWGLWGAFKTACTLIWVRPTGPLVQDRSRNSCLLPLAPDRRRRRE
jgi:hypothetical protein